MDFIQRALTSGVTDIGQIPKDQLKTIKKLVRQGELCEGKDWNYPIPKRWYGTRLRGNIILKPLPDDQEYIFSFQNEKDA